MMREELQMLMSKRLLLTCAALLAINTSVFAADKIGNCEVMGQKGSIPIEKPAKPGQFTLQVALPAPIWYNGDTPETIQDGMEYCLGAEIAWRAGFDKMELVNTSWDP